MRSPPQSYSLMLQPLGRICLMAPFVPPIRALVTVVLLANASNACSSSVVGGFAFVRVVVCRRKRRIGRARRHEEGARTPGSESERVRNPWRNTRHYHTGGRPKRPEGGIAPFPYQWLARFCCRLQKRNCIDADEEKQPLPRLFVTLHKSTSHTAVSKTNDRTDTYKNGSTSTLGQTHPGGCSSRG